MLSTGGMAELACILRNIHDVNKSSTRQLSLQQVFIQLFIGRNHDADGVARPHSFDLRREEYVFKY